MQPSSGMTLALAEPASKRRGLFYANVQLSVQGK